MSVERRIADQQFAIRGLLNQARGLNSVLHSRVNDGDRFGYQYVEFIDFVGGQFNTEVANIAISKDSDFIARRLNIYLSFAPFIHTGGFVPVTPSHNLQAGIDEGFNGLFTISESIPYKNTRINREYQNQPIPFNLVYSAPLTDDDNIGLYRGHVSSLVFDEEWFLPRGSTVQVAITPTQSVKVTSDELGDTIWRCKIVLQGYKKVRAFK